MVKYRDSLDITAAVLEAASAGARKTRIMFQANLSYKILGKYLELAVDNGFLTFTNPNYEVTKTGQEFLARYKLVNDKYSKIQWSLQEINDERKSLEQLCLKLDPKTNTNASIK